MNVLLIFSTYEKRQLGFGLILRVLRLRNCDFRSAVHSLADDIGKPSIFPLDFNNLLIYCAIRDRFSCCMFDSTDPRGFSEFLSFKRSLPWKREHLPRIDGYHYIY